MAKSCTREKLEPRGAWNGPFAKREPLPARRIDQDLKREEEIGSRGHQKRKKSRNMLHQGGVKAGKPISVEDQVTQSVENIAKSKIARWKLMNSLL